MKASQKFPSTFLFLFVFIVLLVAVGCKKEKTDQISSQEVVTDYKFAPNEYVDIVNKLLEHWANQDFDAYAALLAEEVFSYNPYAPHEPGGDAKGTPEMEAKFYKNWTMKNEVENINFSDVSIVALESQSNNVFYKDSGINVVAYATMKMTIFGKPTNNGISWIYHFNNEKLIDKIYMFYDLHQQLDAMN